MSPLESEERHTRLVTMLAAALVSLAWIGVLSLTLSAPAPGSGVLSAGAIFLDRGNEVYPFTIQNLMWLIFWIGVGELFVRWMRARDEERQLDLDILPGDETALYRSKDLIPVYRHLMASKHAKHYRLQRLILRIIQQFQIGKSVDQANSLLNSSLDLAQHEIDLKYNMLRYLVWLIPTIGFLGTVVGIALALSGAGRMPDLEDALAVQGWFAEMTASLGIAFNTTLLALLMAAILMFLLHIIQEREEAALNNAAQVCVGKLINRLYEE